LASNLNAIPGKEAYLSEVLIATKLVLRADPTPLTATMIVIAMPAAIKPYSMAVAPESSDKNLAKMHFNKLASLSGFLVRPPVDIRVRNLRLCKSPLRNLKHFTWGFQALTMPHSPSLAAAAVETVRTRQIVVEIKSPEIGGWLLGHLRAPN
jgi:hypothetical protein